MPDGIRKPVLLDQIRLNCPNDVTVTNTADSGARIAAQGAGQCVRRRYGPLLAPALAGQTITLLSAR